MSYSLRFDPAVNFVEGSMIFADANGKLIQDNDNLFWDDTAKAQGIGTNSIDASALLQLVSTTKGFLMPGMTTTERDDIPSPASGLFIYNVTTDKHNMFHASAWKQAVITPAASLTLGSVPFTVADAEIDDDNVNFFWDNANKRLGIGTNTPNAPLDVHADSPGTVGGFASGASQITNPSASVNANAVITGHNSFGGNKQLWYLGSSSSSNDDVTFLNRQNASLSLGTNSTTRMTIESDGTFIINESVAIGTGAPAASALLELSSTTQGLLPPRSTTAQIDVISTPAIGLLVFDTDEELLRINKTAGWCHIPCGVVTGQFSHAVSQKPGVTTPVSLNFDTNDITLKGISHSTTVQNEEFTATIAKSYTFMLAPQWERTAAGGTETLDFFFQISTDGGTSFTDVVNSNVKAVSGGGDSNVIPLMSSIAMNVDNIVRCQMRISATGDGMGTVFTAAEVGPPTIPATPAQILTIFSGD